MKICNQCCRSLERVITTYNITFRCVCGNEVEEDDNDIRITGHIFHPGEIAEKYQKLIQNSSFDRTNQLVKKDCPSCGLDYMTQLRIGSEEIIIHTCKCGFNSTK